MSHSCPTRFLEVVEEGVAGWVFHRLVSFGLVAVAVGEGDFSDFAFFGEFVDGLFDRAFAVFEFGGFFDLVEGSGFPCFDEVVLDVFHDADGSFDLAVGEACFGWVDVDLELPVGGGDGECGGGEAGG